MNNASISSRPFQGFTLIELLIVMTILTTVLGLGLSSFSRFNRGERLKQSALTLKSQLRFAQAKAISAEKPSVGCTQFVGMQLLFTATTYVIQHECNPEGLVGTKDIISLPSDVTFSPIPTDFTFQTLTNIVDITGDQTITLTNGSQSYSIVVSSNGTVSDSGFL